MIVVWLVGLVGGVLLMPNARWADLSMAVPIYAAILTPFAMAALFVARLIERTGAGIAAGPLVAALVFAGDWMLLPAGKKDAASLTLPIIAVTAAGWVVSFLMIPRRAQFGEVT